MTILSHVEYVTAEDLGEDDVPWLADLFSLGDSWTEDFAIVCTIEDTGPRGYLTLDLEYARMLEASQEAGIPVDLSPQVAAEKMPIHREGWPAHWLGFVE